MTTSGRLDRALQSEGRLVSVLRAAHRIWLQETTTYLEPLTAGDAAFWERWTAVRYMADEFDRQLTRERALLEQLRESLPLKVADRLARDAERISQLRWALDRAGRQRGSAHPVSVIARSLLGMLRSWCADLESASRPVPRDVLPDAAKDLIEDLEFSLQTKS